MNFFVKISFLLVVFQIMLLGCSDPIVNKIQIRFQEFILNVPDGFVREDVRFDCEYTDGACKIKFKNDNRFILITYGQDLFKDNFTEEYLARLIETKNQENFNLKWYHREIKEVNGVQMIVMSHSVMRTGIDTEIFKGQLVFYVDDSELVLYYESPFSELASLEFDWIIKNFITLKELDEFAIYPAPKHLQCCGNVLIYFEYSLERKF